MKAVKYIFLGILLLLGGVFLAGFFLPKSVLVERSVVIDRGAEDVFPYVNSMQGAQQWSPWAGIDPETRLEYFGPESGEGAGMSWQSDDKRVGSGKQTIIESVPNEKVRSELEFGDRSRGESYITLDEQERGRLVNVTWGFSMDFGMNPIMRYMGLMMDDMIGKAYDQGLTNLKALVESQPTIATEEVSYSAGDTQLNGYIAYPSTRSPAPAVLIVHEWWGHNDYARKRAEMLAELGYVAFALDMYGEGRSTEHPKEANAFMTQALNEEGAIQERFVAALELLKDDPRVESEEIAAIGYCFGGAVVLSMARAGVDIDGAVSFHGSLQGLAPIAEGEDTPVLVLNGADDPMVPEEQVEAFKEEMNDSSMPFEVVNYPGAVHAFTNPKATEKGEEYGLPLKYDAEADADSWQRMEAFLQDIFSE